MLDFVRYQKLLTGTKIGCREGDCGACTILVGSLKDDKLEYKSMTSCLMPLGNASGKHIVSIEGINFVDVLNPIQKAMAEEGGTQCGFCTPGFIMSLAGFCLSSEEPTQSHAIAAIDGNICRCTGYKPIERAAARVASLLEKRSATEEPGEFAARENILPSYFTTIKSRLINLQNTITNEVPSTTQTQNIITGGGTDLYVQKHDVMTHADIHFLADHKSLLGITREGNRCLIGPSVTVSDLKNSPVINEIFPDFQRYAKLVSSTPIRNMATLAGNFINASPIGDFTIFFLALNARLVLGNGQSKREIPLRNLYKGYKTLDKTVDESVEQIWFNIPTGETLFHFEKVSKRTHLDIASVNTAIQLNITDGVISDASISAGGVGPIPMYLQKTSLALKGKAISNSLIEEAIGTMKTEISPISDARGSKEYKTLLLSQLIKAHFLELFPGILSDK